MAIVTHLTDSLADLSSEPSSPKEKGIPPTILSKMEGPEVDSQAAQRLEIAAELNALRAELLRAAAKDDQPLVIEELLGKLTKDEAKALVNTANEDGNTPLLLCQSVRCMNLLLDAGADPSHMNGKGESFLHIQAWEANHAMLNAFLKRQPKELCKALLNTPDKEGDTPLLLFVFAEDENVAVMNLLLDAGADPLYANRYGETAVLQFASKGRSEMLKSFLQRVSQDTAYGKEACRKLVNLPAKDGDLPLFACFYARGGNEQCMHLLLDAGANPMASDSDGDTCVHFAVKNGHSEMLESFLQRLSQDKAYGKEVCRKLVNLPNADGITPLLKCFSADNGNAECMHLLLDAGAIPLVFDSKGRNCVHLAARKGRAEMLKAFLERLSKDEAYGEGICKDLVNEAAKNGDTPLIECGYFGDSATLTVLLDAGADPLAVSHEGSSAYLAAREQGHEQLAMTLLQREPRLEGTFALSLLGHAFGYEPQLEFLGTTISFVGSYKYFMNKLILNDLQKPVVRKKSLSLCDEAQYEELTAAFAKSTIGKPSDEEIEEIVEAIQEGKLVILAAGWDGHAIDLVFRDGYLVICNRGRGCEDEEGRERTFFVRKIDPFRVTKDLLRSIIRIDDSPYDVGIQFFYEELPKNLSGTEDGFCEKIAGIAPKPSQAGVCSYDAGKAALRASLALLTKDPEAAQKASRAWAIRHREWVLEFFKKAPSPFDEHFLREIFQKNLGRIKARKVLQYLRYLSELADKIQNGEPLETTLNHFESFCGKKQRKNLEECLRFVCKRRMKTNAFFGRKKFLDPKFPSFLKLRAISAYATRLVDACEKADESAPQTKTTNDGS